MTDESTRHLRELQKMDLEIEGLKGRIGEYEPLLAEVEEPADILQEEVESLEGRLHEMKVEERRLERSADDRRARSKKLEERLKSVRNLREEAAVRAEIDLLATALEGDEKEALTLLDQIRKLEERLEEKQAALTEARAEVEPRRKELLRDQQESKDELIRLEARREDFASLVPTRDLQNYERIRGGGRSVAVAALTRDGACGNCYGMIPIQLQNEINRGADSITCEACGVLLSPAEDAS